MGREEHRRAQRHFHFGRMTVVEQPISGKAAVHRGEAGCFLCLTASAADTRGCIDDQSVGFDEARIDERPQRKDRRGGIATGRGDRFALRGSPRGSARDAVDEAANQPRRLVRIAVPALVSPRVVQPEIGAEIDERDAGVEDCRRDPLAMAMRKRCEDEIDPVEGTLEFLERCVPVRSSKVRMDGGEQLASLALAKRIGDSRAQDARQSAAAARRRHSQRLQGWPSESWGGPYSPDCIFMQVNA